MIKKIHIKKQTVYILAAGLLLVFALLSLVYLLKVGNLTISYSPKEQETIAGSENNFPELSELNKYTSYNDLEKYFQELAKNKGARYAFNLLKIAPLGPNIDLHLLGHAVGNELYKQEGVNGITFCDNDLRNACSHSIVTGMFYDQGEGALPDIAAACRKAPGGIGAYGMCFHGLGHGILSFLEYDMEDAAEMCQKTGTAEYGNSESTQCIGGTIMEIIGGGFHDREIWEKQRPRFLKPNDPTSICRASFFPDQARFMCYEYLTPYLFEVVGANLGNPTDKNFSDAFELCAKVPHKEAANRDACYGGFGKEFTVLAQNRDVRQASFSQMSDANLKKVFNWCMLANVQDGSAACIVHAVSSLYWGGENDRSVAIRFCGQTEGEYYQKTCYMNLIISVGYYSQDSNYKSSFCQELPDIYKEDCKNRLKV